MFEAIAALVALLVAAISWGVVERTRANRAADRAAYATQRALLDRQRVRTEDDRRAADKAADEVHAAATADAEVEHADTVKAIDEVEVELESMTAAEALRRAFGGSLVLALLLFPALGYGNPCDTARDLPGDRVDVSARCARACTSAVVVKIPKLRADLALCQAGARADLAHVGAGLSACERQVAAQRRLLDDAVQTPPAPAWYRSPWFAGAIGIVAGGSLVYAATR